MTEAVVLIAQRYCSFMTVAVTARSVEPTPTAVVVASTTWTQFPNQWVPMLDKVWSFLRNNAPQGLYKQGHNIMLYLDDTPHVEVGVQVSGSFGAVGDVVASTWPGGLVAIAVHTGPIATIGDTHKAVCDWSRAKGYRLDGAALGDLRRSQPDNRRLRCQVFWLSASA